MTTEVHSNPPAVWSHLTGLAGTWFGRTVLIPPSLIMLRITARLLFDPAHAIASTGVSLTTPEALTDMRVVGALTLTLALVIGSAVFSRRNLRAGHATVAVLMALVLAVRMFGFARDGTTLAMGDQRTKVVGEVVFLTLNAAAYVLETRRLRTTGVRP